ncbi:hypothetical protein LOK46_26805 [Methylobacterium sp. NMS14P]|uniref:hypothetical protein n=1 Tax=unclassified Methylobacterium TaxID=2615210 RepID=UPI002358BE5F|nr:hypothetical protein [Methylobacterium sp. NMS14P]WCS24697.1 hypothetical protein LOK46_26805 [Methylobacterium sp. NMS14P]
MTEGRAIVQSAALLDRFAPLAKTAEPIDDPETVSDAEHLRSQSGQEMFRVIA